MAEVTKPIALDESLNTTESTPRNIADVLAEGLDNIAESVVPRAATEIPIQSGSATNTKDYIDTGLSGKADSTDFNNFKALFSNTYITRRVNIYNTDGFNITLPYTATTEKYGNVLLFNPHGSTAVMFTLRPSPVANTIYGSNTWTVTTNDNTTFTIKPASTSWGMSTIIVNYG